MIVTLAELESLGKRALAGRGAPPGIDEDAAAATAWLESRRLPALAALVAQLDRQPIALQPPAGADGRLDARGQSAVLLGGMLIDQAMLSGPDDALVVESLADPLFLLPLADKRRKAGWSFALQWAEGLGASVDADAGVALLGEEERLALGGPVAVTIACRLGPLDQPAPPSDLDSRRRRTLAEGLVVDDALWRRLTEHGASALVPATAESRLRGAGAAASDNE